MKSIDFSTGQVSQYNPVNEERVDEFLGAMLIAGCAGMFASKALLQWWGGIQELRASIAKSRAERAKSKTEKMQEKTKQMEEKTKQLEAKKNRALMVFTKANETAGPGTKDPDGNDMGQLEEVFKKIAAGKATDEDIEYATKVGQRQLTDEEKNIAGRLEASSNKYTQEEVEKFCKEHDFPVHTDPEVVGKMMDAHKEAMAKALQAPGENKTDEEIRQEIKDKLKDAKEEEIPPSLKKDGKLNTKALDKATGDKLMQFAKDCGVDPVKPPKQEGGEGETKPEDKKDDNKVPYTDDEGNETGMYVVKKEDGSYEMQDENGKKTGEADEKDFEEMKQKQDEKSKKEETKPEGGEGETKNDTQGEEDDPTDGDERIDNDDDIEDLDYSSKDDLAKDPSTKYKQRTYKRGSKTFKTKSYYDKKGNSISKDDFMKMKQAFDERQSSSKEKKNKKKNEGWNITKLSSMKSTPVTEAKTEGRINITKERLVYIRYVIDTTTKSVEKVAMERMYNALFDLAFNEDGSPRSLQELYKYIDQTMIENKGKIPGLPTETQIENIDEKVQAFKELHKHEYDAYLKNIDKELLEKSDKKEDDDTAADLLHPAKDETESKTIDDIRGLSTIYGFTNILGLEPERRPSQKDEEAKAEVDKQRKDGSPDTNTKDSKDVKADDISDEQIDKIIGVSK